MALNFDTTAIDKPAVPDHLAHGANDLALRARDVRKSFEVSQRAATAEIEHPTHQKLLAAVRDRSILVYALSAALFAAVIVWEYRLSGEIYSVLADTPLLPLLFFSGTAFFASILIAEGLSKFSIIASDTGKSDRPVERILDRVYDRQRWRGPSRRTLCLFFGVALGIGVEFATYLISAKRVKLLQQAGELTTASASLQQWLPVGLFGAEVLLGIPSFFFMAFLFDFIRSSRLRRQLTKERSDELELRRACIQLRSDYGAAVTIFNSWAEKAGKPVRSIIPANEALREILEKEFGRPDSDTPTSAPPHSDDQTAPKAPAPGPRGGPTSPESHAANGNHQVDDLLNLVDQGIDGRNGTVN